MIKKRYVVIPLLAFCLTATLFIATVTSGKKENPWDVISKLQTKVDNLNTSLLELQERVSTIEAEANQVKTIRLYFPSEYVVVSEEPVYETVFSFEWTPTDSANNAILMMAVYAEVNLTIDSTHDYAYLYWQTNFTGNLPLANEYTAGSGFTSYEDFEYTWTDTCFSHSFVYVPPNQPNYTFDFQMYCLYGIAHVRNVNIILTVADGLPISNP